MSNFPVDTHFTSRDGPLVDRKERNKRSKYPISDSDGSSDYLHIQHHEGASTGVLGVGSSVADSHHHHPHHHLKEKAMSKLNLKSKRRVGSSLEVGVKIRDQDTSSDSTSEEEQEHFRNLGTNFLSLSHFDADIIENLTNKNNNPPIHSPRESAGTSNAARLPVLEEKPIIGIYADPKAVADDWDDDFDIDSGSWKIEEPSPRQPQKESIVADLEDISPDEAQLELDENASILIETLTKNPHSVLVHILDDPDIIKAILYYEKKWRCPVEYVGHAISSRFTDDVFSWKLEYANILEDRDLKDRVELGMARSYIQEKKYQKALDLLQKLESRFIDINLRYFECLLLQGECLLGLEKYSQADEKYSKLISLTSKCNTPHEMWYFQKTRFLQIRFSHYLYIHHDCIKHVAKFLLEVVGMIELTVSDAIRTSSDAFRIDSDVSRFNSDAFHINRDTFKTNVLIPYDFVEALFVFIKLLIQFRFFSEGLALISWCIRFCEEFEFEDMRSKAKSLKTTLEELMQQVPEEYEKLNKEAMTEDMDEEDWDAEIAAEFNLVIERICDAPQNTEVNLFGPFDNIQRIDGVVQRNAVLESELIKYLTRVLAWNSQSNVRAQKFYPKPTQPFINQKAGGPKEQEQFLRNFVRAKGETNPKQQSKTRTSINTKPRLVEQSGTNWYSNTKMDTDPLKNFSSRSMYVEKFTKDWGRLHLQVCWELKRRNDQEDDWKPKIRHIVHQYFTEIATYSRRIPVLDDQDRQERLSLFVYSMSMLDLARYIFDMEEGKSIFRYLDDVYTSLPFYEDKEQRIREHEISLEVAKLEIELFRVETCAHFAVAQLNTHVRGITTPHQSLESSKKSSLQGNLFLSLKTILRRSKKLILKFKRGNRSSSKSNDSLLVDLYASCLSSLYCQINGISPIDGTTNDSIYAFLLKNKTSFPKSDPMSQIFIVEGVSMIINEIEDIYDKIANISYAKVKVAYARAHHAKHTLKDYALCERLLYDCLLALNGCHCPEMEFFPQFLVSGSFAGTIMKNFGYVLLNNSKYQYAIAIFRAYLDGHALRFSRQELYSVASDVASIAIQRSDWQSAVDIMYSLRVAINPKDGKRNEFVQFCLALSSLCSFAGCFASAVVPLQACLIMFEDESNQIRHRLLERVAARQMRSSKLIVRILPKSIRRIVLQSHKALSERIAYNPLAESTSVSVQSKSSEIDTDHFFIEHQRIKLLYDIGWYEVADQHLAVLLKSEIPHGYRLRVYELLARVKLRRGEVSKCIHYCEEMVRNHTACVGDDGNDSFASRSFSMTGDIWESGRITTLDIFFVRIKALLFGERYDEALSLSENALTEIQENQVRYRAKIFGLRGKILFALSRFDKPPDYETLLGTSYSNLLSSLPADISSWRGKSFIELDGKIASAALDDLEQSSNYYKIIGDEVHAAKMDVIWAQVCLDWLFRNRIIRNTSLEDASHMTNSRKLDLTELYDVIMAGITFAQRVNIPFLLTQGLINLAEFEMCANASKDRWRKWLKRCWTHFSKFFTDVETGDVFLVSVASMTFLMKLKDICARMIRLLFFETNNEFTDINRHIRMFETYCSLCIDIERRLNLANPAPKVEEETTNTKSEKVETVVQTPEKNNSFSGFWNQLRAETIGLAIAVYQKGILQTKDKIFMNLKAHGVLLALSTGVGKFPALNLHRFLGADRSANDFGLSAMQILNDPQSPLAMFMTSLNKNSNMEQDEIFEDGLESDEKVWVCLHRLKMETRKYSLGQIQLDDLSSRNNCIIRTWMRSTQKTKMGWTVPDLTRKSLIYFIRSAGLLGQYHVSVGKVIYCTSFGGKENGTFYQGDNEPKTEASEEDMMEGIDFIYSLVKNVENKHSSHVGNINMDFEQKNSVLNKLRNDFFKIPTNVGFDIDKKRKSKTIVLICDISLQAIPWELFFKAMLIRSLRLIDSIIGMQGGNKKISENEERDLVIKFVAFSSKHETKDDADRARKEKVAFNAISYLETHSAKILNERFNQRGFRDPRHMNAMVRPTGPFPFPVSVSQAKGFILFGANRPIINLIRISGLGSTSVYDLVDAVSDESAHISVFIFTYADLVDCSPTTFGLLRRIPESILLFVPANDMQIFVDYLEKSGLCEFLGGTYAKNRKLLSIIRIFTRSISAFATQNAFPLTMFFGEGIYTVMKAS